MCIERFTLLKRIVVLEMLSVSTIFVITANGKRAAALLLYNQRVYSCSYMCACDGSEALYIFPYCL